ncbi:MAG: malonic semialdehyde reductase [Acidobacteriota bacterium]|nr:malonic semialdehyde reductase [Acidobacteriota bacterium]
MNSALSQTALDQLFTAARTHGKWTDEPIAVETVHQLYELTKWGPTSANASPARFVFVHSDAAKERLRPTLAAGNVDKTMAAPLTVIVAHDMEFYEKLPELAPHIDARSWFVGNDGLIQETAFRNGTLQGAYLILAARALGLDCGAMSGFDAGKVDREFFDGTSIRSNFLLNIGHGDPDGPHPRAPRLEFGTACQIL